MLYETFFRKLDRRFLVLWGIFLILFVAMIDILTGYEVAFSIFYLVPVSFFTWFLGKNWGIRVACACACIWFFADVAMGHRYLSPWVPYWNALVRLGFFVIVAVLLGIIQTDLQKLNQAYKEVQALSEVKSEFTWMVSSRLRQPMMQVMDQLETLYKDEKLGQAERMNRIELARRNVGEMLRLVSDVTNFTALQSKNISLELSKENINAVIASVVQFHSYAASKFGISIETLLDQNIPMVMIERESIVEVLNQLLSNAIKFSNKGTITVSSAFKNAKVTVSVQDQGMGISKDSLESIFKPFEQLVTADGQKPEGTGIGLAMAKLIVERHHGKIWAESKIGSGTTLLFTLPLS